MDRYVNALKRHVSYMDAQNPQPRFATVQSYNPATHTVKVMIQPEAVLSGWLPIATGLTANGWGIVAPPMTGEQVIIVPQDGDNSSYVVIGSVFSTQSLPPKPSAAIGGQPVPIQQGEIGLVSQDGNVVVRLGGNGQCYVKAANSVNIETQTANIKATAINLIASSQITLTTPLTLVQGNLQVTGDITDQNASRGSLAALRTAYDTHQHSGVQTGLGSTGITNKTIGS